MEEGKPSRTADVAALYRACESVRPEHERVCYDPYAKHFLNGIYRIVYTLAARSRIFRSIGFWYDFRFQSGIRCWGIGRHRYMDDYLRTCITEGIEQLVILGAGYDSRAYRIDELKRGEVRVFEVDHPQTQQAKKDKVRRIFGKLPDSVVYVSVDFNKETLGQRLFESGYDSDSKTLFIWEAVTMYLTPEAVDATLAFLASNSGEGSSIIFDYLFRTVADGTCELRAARRFRDSVRRQGDPATFGIEEDEIEAFLLNRGFHQVKNVTGQYLKHAYFEETNQKVQVSPMFGYVHATVKRHK